LNKPEEVCHCQSHALPLLAKWNVLCILSVVCVFYVMYYNCITHRLISASCKPGGLWWVTLGVIFSVVHTDISRTSGVDFLQYVSMLSAILPQQLTVTTADGGSKRAE